MDFGSTAMICSKISNISVIKPREWQELFRTLADSCGIPYVYTPRIAEAIDVILRHYPRKPEDGRIDWRENNILINACNNSYSDAFCDFEGQKLIIWDAELAPEETFLAVLGQVAEITETYVDVATQVREVEFGGRVVCPWKVCQSARQRFQ